MQPQLTVADIEYPESDGKPMSDNTVQARWIVLLYTNLDLLLPGDFVAADLFWYPEPGYLPGLAPDVMVVLGRPKGDRSSYKTWEEGGVQPQVVFEIRSPSNTNKEMRQKLAEYDAYGVEEYYHYDPRPNKNLLEIFLRQEGRLQLQPVVGSFDSPLLRIRFLLLPTGLQILDPAGEPFRLLTEERNLRLAAEQRAQQEAARAERLAARLRALGIEEP